MTRRLKRVEKRIAYPAVWYLASNSNPVQKGTTGRSSKVKSLTNFIHTWCEEQASVYYGQSFEKNHVLSVLSEYNDSRPFFFLYDFKDGEVCIRPKPAFFSEGEIANSTNSDIDRARKYLTFLQEASQLSGARFNMTIGMEVPDEVFESTQAPVFGYQKWPGAKLMLMPDIDFLNFDFYSPALLQDELAYEQKEARAVFVGATTGGGTISEEAAATLSVPRIRSACYFKQSEHVDFTLPLIVQTASDDVKRMIYELGIGGPILEWRDQFRRKFIISIDGNGATCSRVIITLKSKSVLLKYRSDRVLYYFSGLVPWHNYIPIYSDADVVDIVNREITNPGLYEYVSHNSNSFYNSYLTKNKVYEYTSRILCLYRDMCNF